MGYIRVRPMATFRPLLHWKTMCGRCAHHVTPAFTFWAGFCRAFRRPIQPPRADDLNAYRCRRFKERANHDDGRQP